MDFKENLINLKKERDFFIGIDSDGCAFPTMELKHKECFIPNVVKFWKLQSISKYVRETAEWINLYSIYRGMNRFISLVKTVELLADRKEIKNSKFPLPDMKEIVKFINSGIPLSNSGLAEYMREYPSPVLELVMKWSVAVNVNIDDMVVDVKPFPFVRESLMKLKNHADMMVVSATPVGALEKEWEEHDMAKYVKAIAGQEMGSKSNHLKLAASGKYEKGNVLMIGDAPGDHKAAESIGALFYPIKPGYEEKSWEQFYKVVIDKFLKGKYRGNYQKNIITDFYKVLPKRPHWK